MPEIENAGAAQPIRRRLPDEREAIVHHFNVGGYGTQLKVPQSPTLAWRQTKPLRTGRETNRDAPNGTASSYGKGSPR